MDKKPVVIVSIVTALCLLGDSMLYIVLPIYWEEAGLTSLWEVGILLSVNRFVRLPLNPFIGWLYKNITLKTGLVVAVVLGTMTTIGYGVLEGFWIWLLLRSVWGLSWSLLRMGGFFTVIRYSDSSNRGNLMGIYNGLHRLGSLFGMLLGGLLASLIGLSQVAFLFGIIGLVGIPLVTVFIPRKEKASSPSPSSLNSYQKGFVLSWQVVKVIVSGLLITMLLQGLFTSTLSFVIESHFTDSIAFFGVILGATTLSGILQGVRWIWEPFLATRFGRWSDGPGGRIPPFLFSLVGATVGFALIPFDLPLPIWFGATLFVQIMFTSLTTLMDALASDIAQRTSVITVMTVYSVATDLGAALGPIFGYMLIELDNGLFMCYLGGAAIFLVLVGLWYEKKTAVKHYTGSRTMTH